MDTCCHHLFYLSQSPAVGKNTRRPGYLTKEIYVSFSLVKTQEKKKEPGIGREKGKAGNTIVMTSFVFLFLILIYLFKLFIPSGFFLFFYCHSIIVVPIFPTSSSLPLPPLVPTVNPHPAIHVLGSFISTCSLTRLFPFFTFYPPPTSLLAPVSLLLVSMSLVLFYSFVYFVH